MSGYLLFKSLHLIAVISWMAGLLYLPRIFVYHVENSEKDEVTQIFETMERKLYNYIMRPAMLLSWFFGIILIWICLLYTSPSPRDRTRSRMPSSA